MPLLLLSFLVNTIFATTGLGKENVSIVVTTGPLTPNDTQISFSEEMVNFKMEIIDFKISFFLDKGNISNST